jgi:hypothetical protein
MLSGAKKLFTGFRGSRNGNLYFIHYGRRRFFVGSDGKHNGSAHKYQSQSSGKFVNGVKGGGAGEQVIRTRRTENTGGGAFSALQKYE